MAMPQSLVQIDDLDATLDALSEIDRSEWVGLDLETAPSRKPRNSRSLLPLTLDGKPRYLPGLDPHLSEIRLLTLSTMDRSLVLDTWRTHPGPWLEWLRDHGGRVIIHNAKFDLAHLQQAGLYIPSAWDTMLADRLLRAGLSGSASLQAVAERYLNKSMDKGLQTSDWSGDLSAEQLEYAAQDAMILPRLRVEMGGRLLKAGLRLAATIEFGAVPAFAMLSRTGLMLDSDAWAKLAMAAESELLEVEAKLREMLPGPPAPLTFFETEPVPVNLQSPEQVKDALQRLGINVAGTDEHELSLIDHPVAELLLRHRTLTTKLKMFLRKMPAMVHPLTGRVHADYWQLGAASGRTTSSNPNIQQIPHDPTYRRCFMSGPGRTLVIADYSQIELRIVAEEAMDPRMLAAFEEGVDIHRQTAALVTGKDPEQVSKEERQMAKAVNFGLVYGMGAPGLVAYAWDAYGVRMSLSQASAFRKRYFEAYPNVKAWHDHQVAAAKRDGGVRTLTGRIRTMDKPLLTVAANSPTQGTGADILKLALSPVAKMCFERGWDLVAEVHDEIVLEVPDGEEQEAAAELEKLMVAAGQKVLKQVKVEAESSTGKTWADK